MQQRVALARALVYRPRVLLLDEPLAALDKKLREEMRVELREIQRSVGITTIFVTHDQTEALSLSDRIAVMNRGRIEQLGRPREIYDRPATRFVAEFIGASSVLRGHAVSPDQVELGPGVVLQVSSGPLPIEAPIDLAIRPERVVLDLQPRRDRDEVNAVDGRVVALSYLGAQMEVTVELLGGQRVLGFVAEPSATSVSVGQPVSVTLPPRSFIVLP
jgi:ABC-type Fe3+/spermidine/putrescine transport system ATPase subunit